MSDLERKPRRGCFSTLLQILGSGILVLFVMVFFSSLGSVKGNSKPSSRPTSTPVVTAVPTSTPEPDDCIAWATYYANQYMPKDMKVSEVQISTLSGSKYLSIACDMDVMINDKTYIRSAASFICDMIPLLRDKQGFDHITFLFYGPFIDKYGNDVQSLGMRAMYSRATLQKVNTEYFEDYLYSDPRGVFKAADTHMIHSAYKD